MRETKARKAITYSGIGNDAAARLRQKFGENLISEKKRKSFFGIFIKNLGDPVIRILLCALIINVLFMLRILRCLKVDFLNSPISCG